MSDKTLSELQEEDEKLDTELSVARKRAMLKAIDAKMGQKGSWRLFSDNGKLSGINWTRIKNRLKL